MKKDDGLKKRIEMIMETSGITKEIAEEVHRARTLHTQGILSLHEAYAVILEELDEFWDAVKVNPKKLSPEARAKREYDLRNELIQTAAMCVRAITDLGMEKPEWVN